MGLSPKMAWGLRRRVRNRGVKKRAYALFLAAFAFGAGRLEEVGAGLVSPTLHAGPPQ